MNFLQNPYLSSDILFCIVVSTEVPRLHDGVRQGRVSLFHIKLKSQFVNRLNTYMSYMITCRGLTDCHGLLLNYTRKNLTTCQQDEFATGLWQACQQVVTMLLFYQVATRLSLTTCWQIVELRVYTRKNAQVVTNLQQTSCSNGNAVPTTCQQDVFALLVPSLLTSCQRLVDNLLQGCWAQQTCYKLFQQLVIVLQFNNLSTSCKWQPCTVATW
jgi:hypothetical protein